MSGDVIQSATGEKALPKRPVLWRPVTILSWALVCLAVLLMAVFRFIAEPLGFLADPARTVIHVGDKSLDLNEAVRRAPGWERATYAILGSMPADHMRNVADAYGRAAAHVEGDGSEYSRADWRGADALRARQAILAAESDAWWGLVENLFSRLSESEHEYPFISALSFAYRSVPVGIQVTPQIEDLSILGVETNESWAYDVVLMRIAEQVDSDHSLDFEARILDRGRRALNRSRVIGAVYVSFLVVGGIVAMRRRTIFRRGYEIAGGLTVAPWSLKYGLDVLARFVVCAAAILVLALAMTDSLYVVSSLLAGLPMLLLSRRYYFGPHGLSLTKALGLEGVSWKTLIPFTLALIAVDQGGALLITGITNAFGLESGLEEGIEETLLFGRPAMAGLLAIDGIVSASFMEEVAFRGLLYTTLRSRCRPLPAALISASLFGVVHIYSLAGLLIIVWTGFVLALAYERCRSLWPCVLAHSFNNLLYFADQVLLYR